LGYTEGPNHHPLAAWRRRNAPNGEEKRADLRIQLAVHRYQTKEISLAKAASLAGVRWAQMKDILVERGIQPRLGLETMDEAEEGVRTLRDYFEGQP
jgi:predicted HTH domain antitoxin